MAQDKKSFLLYADIIYTIEHLTNEEKGKLFQHLLEYVNDFNPILEDRILLIAWKPIERQLKRDLEKYENKKEERSRSGQLGNLKKYNPDLYDKVKSETMNLNDALAIADTRKASHSDTKLAVNVNDTVNGNVNVNDIDYVYNKFVDEVKNHAFDEKIEILYMQLKLRKGTLTSLLKEFRGVLIKSDKVHKNTKELFKHFDNWLNVQDRLGKLDKYRTFKKPVL